MNYLAAEHMPELLERWDTVEVYGPSWGATMRDDAWKRCAVLNLKPWHVWRYEAPKPSGYLMSEAAKIRERMNVGALKGNGFYVDRGDYSAKDVES